MSKQIYIDSNGNEVLVSGTVATAGNLPLGSDFSDPTSTAGAINDIRTITNGTIASGDIGASITFSRYKLWKCNGVAHINANIAVSATIAGTSKICDLPSGFGAGTGEVYDFTTIDTLGNTIRGYLNGDRISFNFVGNVQSGAGVIFQITWKVA